MAFDRLALFFAFWLGASLGSFLNVLVCRFTLWNVRRANSTGFTLWNSREANSTGFTPDEKFSFLKSARGRSKCPLCRTTLCWFELIPIISFIVQKGRCRHCKEKISWQYIIVEMLCGFVFLFLVLKFWHFPLLILLWWLIAFFLILLSAIDFYHYLIPDILIKALFCVGIFIILSPFIFQFFGSVYNYLRLGTWDLLAPKETEGFPSGFENWKLKIENLGDSYNYLGYYQHLFPKFKLPPLNHLIGLFSFSVLLFIISISSGEKYMGMGDAKLMAALGLILGWPAIILVFVLSFLTGACAGLILMIFKRKSFASAVPFGPFIAGSALAVALCGEEILRIYFKIAGL